VSYVRTGDVERLLRATDPASPSTASAVTIAADLRARAFSGSSLPVDLPGGTPTGQPPSDRSPVLSMVVARYPDLGAARRTAKEAAARTTKAPKDLSRGELLVEMVVETRTDGRRRVVDPSQGVAAMAWSDVVSWGGFGLVFGAVVGFTGGGGLWGLLEGGVVTGIGWAVFGLVAGALYGLWAGRSLSARRLSGVGAVLPAGSSAVLAWAEGDVGAGATDVLDAPGAERLVVSFTPVPGGAVLGVA
jgi:hypothetical protein